MLYIIRFSFVLLFLSNWVYSQYLYTENFEDISDWTVTFSGNNQWINGIGNDSIYSIEGKCIYVSCASCGQSPLYEIGLVSNQTEIKMNSPVTIPSNNYKIKFSYFNVARLSDILSVEYSYDNSTWNNLTNLSMSTKWKRVSIPITDLSGFTPGSSVYFRFVFNIGTIVTPSTRHGCGIDNFSIVSNDWDITNISTILSISNNEVLYLKNADYTSNSSSSLYNSGSFILDNGSDFANLGTYMSSGDSVIFRGNMPQTFTAPIQPVGTVFIDKSNVNQTVMVDSFLEIKDRLHFVKGVIKTSANRFPINLLTSSNPIASDDGFVDARVKYYTTISNRLFPTGHKGVYRPIILDNGNLHYTIRYRRENSSATFNNNFLDSVSTQGYWAVRVENIGIPGSPQKTVLSYKTGDFVYNVDSTRIAISENVNGPYTTDENFITTHSGTTSNGTVEIDKAIELPLYYLRVGYAKDGRINLNAMLQGPLMDSTKVLWQQTSFAPANWTTNIGSMKFITEANSSNVETNRPWKKAFDGLAFVNTVSNTNKWSSTGSGVSTAQMNADVPISFSASEEYYVEFDYFYDGNNDNYFQFQYSINNGATWNDLPVSKTPSTYQKWDRFKFELNSDNFPGFIAGTTPIRFGFKGTWGPTHITDANVPSPLIDNLKITQKVSQPEEMTTHLSSSYILDSLIGIGEIATHYKAPLGAVDVIKIEIRDINTSIYTVIDEQIAWLMYDGTIKSLSGLNYLKFVHRNSDSGYMVIKHRNHLPVMTPNPITFNPTTETTLIDFTDITNIMDATAYKYKAGPDKYALYLGNATEDFLNSDYYETNATDFYVVSTKNNQNPDRSYHREDLNLDGYVNGNDFELVQLGNNNLYFTTVPEP